MELTPWSNLGLASPNAWLIGVALLASLVAWTVLSAVASRQGTAAEKTKAGAVQAVTAIAGLAIGFGVPYAAQLVSLAA